MNPRHDEHYLHDVTSLGDSRQMVAHAPIYAQNRIKLVDVGTLITSALFEKLVRHKLLPTIDQCITIENELTVDGLVEEAKRQIVARPFLAYLASDAKGADELLGPLCNVVLEPPLALKLTVMQERRAELFRHSLEMTIVALYLGRASALLDTTNLRFLAAAALFHDIGELHIDPAILDPAHEITDEERRHIYAHPLTAYLILNEYPAYSPKIRTAVLEHHEREDGSGYPRGAPGHEISFLGRILVLSEVVASQVRKLPANGDLSRIGMALKLSKHKYDPSLVLLLSKVFREVGHTHPNDSEGTSFLSQIERIGSLIGSWQATYESLAESGKTKTLADYVNNRVTELDRALSSAGCHPDQLSLAYRSAKDDADGFAEMAVLADEGIWQFRDIVHETRRRWDKLKDGEAERQVVRGWLDSCDSVLDAHVT